MCRRRPIHHLAHTRCGAAMFCGALALSGCFKSVVDATADSDAAATATEEDVDLTAIFTCTPCVQTGECGGGWCVQFAAETFCASDCTQVACAAGLVCAELVTEAGESHKACVPPLDICSGGGPGADSAAADAESPSDAAAPTDAETATDAVFDVETQAALPPICGAYDGPGIDSCCKGCPPGSGNCQANGCFGGWYCKRDVCKCLAAPPAAECPVDAIGGDGTGSDGAGDQGDAAAQSDTPDAAALTAAGGTVAELTFAVVGDTRPAMIEDTKGYPSAIAKKIWQGVQASGVPFALTTGDYIFATAWGTQAAPQLDLYLTAAGTYGGLRLPALGNHECTGATNSNCGTGNKDGLTKNYLAYLSKMLAPLGLEHPYYTFDLHAKDGAWTAKFVFIAANAWDSEQAAWLEAAMAKPATYTFVIRHEPVAANTAPGVTPSEKILANYPVTLRIVGHTHTFSYKPETHEVVVGNGGAPLSGGVNYGYVIAKRRDDEAIEFRAYDYSTGKAFSTFAVYADGKPAP